MLGEQTRKGGDGKIEGGREEGRKGRGGDIIKVATVMVIFQTGAYGVYWTAASLP